MSTSLTDVMRRFAQFLSASWDAANTVASSMERFDSTELMSDWAQANWELLVETPFRELTGCLEANLEPYGEGADCNEASSRVWSPGGLPTHRVECRPAHGAPMLDLLTGSTLDATAVPVVFDHFAIESEHGWHEQAPPFDCVLGYRGDQEVLLHLLQVQKPQILLRPSTDQDP